jgi:predicted DNA-binding transcriptional regulator AlpA
LRYNVIVMTTHNSATPIIPISQWNRPVTAGDLQMLKDALKEELLNELKIMLLGQPQKPSRKWLKNKAVIEMLGISAGTLQLLRDNGTLPHSRLGRNIYYDPADIDQEIERRKTSGRHHPQLYKTHR